MEVFKPFQHVLEVLLGRQNGGPDNGKGSWLTDVVILVAIYSTKYVGQTSELTWLP